MTLFPDAIDAMMGQSIIGRAQARGLVTITAHQILSLIHIYMLEKLEQAEHFIFMEFFIIAQGQVWDRMEEISVSYTHLDVYKRQGIFR